jgi:hypothetical protein
LAEGLGFSSLLLRVPIVKREFARVRCISFTPCSNSRTTRSFPLVVCGKNSSLVATVKYEYISANALILSGMESERIHSDIA